MSFPRSSSSVRGRRVKLLPDTHAAVWWLTGDRRFGSTAERMLVDPTAPISRDAALAAYVSLAW